MEEFFSNIGQLILAGGGGAAAAWMLIQAFGNQWLESRFAKQLEAFRHEQQKEMEQVRYKINSYFDRAVRLHAIEFEILPEIWGRLSDAYHATGRFISWLRAYPDLDRMKPEQLEEFLQSGPLLEYQKGEIRTAKDKTTTYIDFIFFHDLNETRQLYYDFNGYLTKKAVLLEPDIEAKFKQISDLIWAAIVEYEVAEKTERRTGGRRTSMPEHPARDRLQKEGAPLMEEIRKVVQTALRDSKSAISG